MKFLRAAALLAACALLGLSQSAGAAEGSLPEAVKKVMTRHKIPSSAVSIEVQAVDENTPRLALNIDVPRNPASTAKVVTTWGALDMFGPTYTLPTRIFTRGPIKGDVLQGDLIIKGYGDPFLVIEDFWALVGQIRRSGIRQIDGDVIIDDTEFLVEEDDPAAFDGKGDALYNVLPSALIVNFKSIDFIFDANPATGKVAITSVPELANLNIVNHVRLSNGPCRGNGVTAVMHAPPAGSVAPDEEIEFAGQMPARCDRFQTSRAIMSPAAYTFGAFKALWQHWGGTIKGGYRVAARPANATALLTWQSRPLAEIIRPLNKWSNNLMARMLLFTIGARDNPAPVTRAQGEAALLKHLASRGLSVDGVIIDNGSGLSRTTRVTSRFMTALLREAWRSPTMPEFISSLAIVGVDGTARRRFRSGPERGRMHLKTGSLQNVSAVTGFVHAQNGKTFTVNVMVNYANANYGIGTELQNAVLAWTYKQH